MSNITTYLGLLLLASCSIETQHLPTRGDASPPHRGREPASENGTTPDASKQNPDLSTVIAPDTSSDLTTQSQPPDTSPDLSKIDNSPSLSKPDVLADLTPDLIPYLAPDLSPDLTPNRTPDLAPDLTPDSKPDSRSPDTSPNLPLGTSCSRNTDCNSSFCTNGVCCNVAVCLDTCVPGTSTCAPYSGFTCAPYGTCRGF
jgi:hypothetical protein